MELFPQRPASVALACATIWIAVRFIRTTSKRYKYSAHQYLLIGEDTLWRNLLPSATYVPGIGYGNNRPYHAKFSEFLRAGKDAYIQVSLTSSRINVFLADPRAIKAIASQRSRYVKDVEVVMKVTGMYGKHIAGVEGDDWKRHRKANQRAFSEKNIQLVWVETEDVMSRLFAIWEQQNSNEVRVENVGDMTEKLALLVISTAAFGRRVSWDPAEDEIPEGRQMSFQKALRIVSGGLVTQLFIPWWAANLNQRTKDITTAFSEFGLYLKEMISARRKGAQVDSTTEQDTPLAFSSPDSLFNIMMAASNEGEEKFLEESEVAADSFVFLFAGHETTAHTLAFALGLLAVYSNVQEEVYAQIKQAMGARKKLEYSDINSISLVGGVFWETLRMYPVVDQINKLATEDSIVSVARNGPGTDENTREDFFIPKDALIWFSIMAMHYNPKYWPEPETFRPSRFLEPYNKDAFMAFSTGHRSCIGRKFAETEGIAALAMFLSRYEVRIDETKFPTIPGESLKAREARLLNPSHEVTLAPSKLPLVFVRR